MPGVCGLRRRWRRRHPVGDALWWSSVCIPPTASSVSLRCLWSSSIGSAVASFLWLASFVVGHRWLLCRGVVSADRMVDFPSVPTGWVCCGILRSKIDVVFFVVYQLVTVFIDFFMSAPLTQKLNIWAIADCCIVLLCSYTGIPTFDVVPPMTTVTGYGFRIAVDSAHSKYTWWARHYEGRHWLW